MSDPSGIDDRLREIQGLLMGADGRPDQPSVTQPPAAGDASRPPARGTSEQATRLAERTIIAPAEARARAIIAAAEREATRIVADACDEVDELTRQIDELVSLRARIIDAIPAMPGGPPALEDRTVAPVAGWLEHRRFGSAAGTVILTVGPFPDAAAVQRFERALMTIDVLQDVELREYESDRCVFALTMRRPTPLVAEIEGVSAARITVDRETATALAATFVELAPAAVVRRERRPGRS